MSNSIVQLRDVSVLLGSSKIVQNVSLNVGAGERIAILGANGAGKSSLLRVINHLQMPSKGTVQSPSANEQALIFQRPVLLKRNVIDNVSFTLIARGATRSDAHRIAMEKLEATGLLTFANRYARTLSGGEQQKLALARAWAMQPKLLLADEPTANLAPAAIHAVESILQRMGDAGTTLIFATHNRGQAKRLATRIVFMVDGRVAEDQMANDFFTKPLSTEAIDYLNVEHA
jgi:tungstate transport system ATP-binding protein